MLHHVLSTLARAAAGSAALWIGGQAHDLNALTVALPAGVVLLSAEDVNDAGQIVGQADVGGLQRPFLLEPIAP